MVSCSRIGCGRKCIVGTGNGAFATRISEFINEEIIEGAK
ncbi:unnamed protein product [Onchocerca flexuosa]|uniref:PFK domain-containing protein n=1 Tax=Onchocerca flexuosa TaxID=387005 RepID=A0A183HSZ8_9BILA|nr:unnamed protein product [Onchocerca flexuosa]